MTIRTDPTFSVRQDRQLIRPNGHSQRFLLARITAPRATSERARPPVNLAIVLDRSGSMSGEKLRVAKAAVEEAIARLQPDDRFSVVVYDDVVDVVIESTSASGEARRGAVDRLRSVEARGSTNLGEGWLRGCEQVAGHLAEQGVNRCLLLTDGLANVGHHRPRAAGEPRRRAPRTGRLDLHVRGRQRLRRAAAPGAGRRRRWPLLLHRGCAADPRRDHVRGGRDARGRRTRRQSRDHGPRRHRGSSRSARTRPRLAATGPRSRSATSAPSRSSRSSCGCRSRTGRSARRRAPSSP